MKTRPAQTGDLSTLAEYWYDRMALIQQNRPLRVSASAQADWQGQAQAWLSQAKVFWVVTSQDESDLLGGACVSIDMLEAGAERAELAYGRLLAWVLDLHVPHKQQGAGKRLLASLQMALSARGIQRLCLSEAPSLAVEQAFWLSRGLRQKADGCCWLEW